jgi:hypothetical protein
MLMMLGIASCKSTSGVSDYGYEMKDNTLYLKGVEIGYLEAVKLQDKGGEIRREVVFVIYNETEPVGRAREIITYLKSRISKSDIELKTLYKKNNINKIKLN